MTLSEQDFFDEDDKPMKLKGGTGRSMQVPELDMYRLERRSLFC